MNRGPRFGRTPPVVYLIIGLFGLAAVTATFSAVTPWYNESGTLPVPGGQITFSQAFPPGPGGYIHSCSFYFTSNFSSCGNVNYNYSAGNGTQLLTDLYWGILGTSVTTAILSCVTALVIAAGLQGKVRAKRMGFAVVILLAVAIVAGAAGTLALPAFQGQAFKEMGGCVGFNNSATPCNSLSGHASCVGRNGSTCVETDFSWRPDIGWYLSIASAGLLAAALIALRFQSLVARCPSCGAQNRFPAKFCDTCANPLPSWKRP